MTDSLDDLIARQQRIVDLHEAHQPEHASPIDRGYYEQDKAILARLVSLRDAGKELPDISGHEVTHVIVDHPNGGDYPVRLRSVLFTKKIVDALRAHAVADRARVKELEECVSRMGDRHISIMRNHDEMYAALLTQSNANLRRADSAESRVRELEAEREAMMAKLREPSEFVCIGVIDANGDIYPGQPEAGTSIYVKE